MPARSRAVIAPEFVKVVRGLRDKRMEKRVYNGAVSAGARVIAKEARNNLKRFEDNVSARDIVVKRQRRSRVGAAVSYAIGLSSARWWLVFKEYGRQALQARGAAIPMHLEDGSVVFTKSAKAVPARPFFRPAVDSKTRKAWEVVHAQLLRGLERESKRLAGPFKRSGRGRR